MPDESNTDPNDDVQTPSPDQPAAPASSESPAQGGDEGTDATDLTAAPPPKGAAPPADPQKHRNAFIAKLNPVDDSGEAPTPADPPTKPAAAPAAAATPAKPATPAAPGTEPEADVELTNETAAAMKPGDVRRKINRLITKVKDAEPYANVGREIIQNCKDAGFEPAEYKKWVKLGIGMQKRDPAAVEAFGALVQSMGYVAADQAAAAAAPVDVNPAVLAWLTEREQEAEITPEAARTLRAMLAGQKPAAAAAPAKAAAPAPQPRQQPAQQPPSTPSPLVAAQERATAKIDSLVAEYETRHGAATMKGLEPRINAALAKRRGSHPDAWPDIVRAVIDAEVAKLPKGAPVQPVVRPGPGPAPAAKTFASQRERIVHQYSGG